MPSTNIAERAQGKDWLLLERLLARQQGVVAVRQVLPFGIPRSTLWDYFRRHGFEEMGYGVHAAPWSTDGFPRRCAIERLCGARARLLTGAAPLALLGVRHQAPSQIDVWVGQQRNVAQRPSVRQHRGLWVPGERATRVLGHPATPVLRWLRDAARDASPERLLRDIGGLDRRRLVTPDRVLADLHRSGSFRGKPKLREAAEVAVLQLVHSRDERTARELLATLSERAHPRPLLIEHSGWRIAEVDIPFCRLRHGVEIDGPTHDRDGQLERDAARDAKLDVVHWRVSRYPVDFVRERPVQFVEAVRRDLAAAEARRPVPWPCRRCGT